MAVVIGFIGAALVAVLAWRLGALDAGGAVAAFGAGGIIFGFGGLGPSAALLAFFLTGSFLSSLSARPGEAPLLRKEELAGGYARNWRQVVANGFVPTVAMLAARFVPVHSMLLLDAFYGSIAAMCADSWGTEIGTRFGGRVYDAITGRVLERGLSGGVSIAGLAASAGGAALIALIAAIPLPVLAGGAPLRQNPGTIAAIFLAGLLGSVSDSILGSTVQAKYRDPETGSLCEVSRPAKTGTRHQKPLYGYKQINNNVVNFVASAIGALIVVVILASR